MGAVGSVKPRLQTLRHSPAAVDASIHRRGSTCLRQIRTRDDADYATRARAEPRTRPRWSRIHRSAPCLRPAAAISSGGHPRHVDGGNLARVSVGRPRRHPVTHLHRIVCVCASCVSKKFEMVRAYSSRKQRKNRPGLKKRLTRRYDPVSMSGSHEEPKRQLKGASSLATPRFIGGAQSGNRDTWPAARIAAPSRPRLIPAQPAFGRPLQPPRAPLTKQQPYGRVTDIPGQRVAPARPCLPASSGATRTVWR